MQAEVGEVESQSQFNGTCMLQKWEEGINRRAVGYFEAWLHLVVGAKLVCVCGRA